jgi:hypothetical protein
MCDGDVTTLAGKTEIPYASEVMNAVFMSLTLELFDNTLAMKSMGSEHAGMWDEEDGFFCDVLRRSDGSVTRLKLRSLGGLLPL